MSQFILKTWYDSHDLSLHCWEASIRNDNYRTQAKAEGIIIYEPHDLDTGELWCRLDAISSDYSNLGAFLEEEFDNYEFWRGTLVLLNKLGAKNPGKGWGSKLMEELTRALNDPSILLFAKNFQKENNPEHARRLIAWYKRQGFKTLNYEEFSEEKPENGIYMGINVEKVGA